MVKAEREELLHLSALAATILEELAPDVSESLERLAIESGEASLEDVKLLPVTRAAADALYEAEQGDLAGLLPVEVEAEAPRCRNNLRFCSLIALPFS